MTAWSTYRACPPDFVARRLRALAQCCSDLHRRVRQAVAEAIGETVAGLSRDAMDGLLGLRRVPARTAAVGYGHTDDFDPWADEPDDTAWSAWQPAAEELDCTESAPPLSPSADVCTLAL